jgi:hypothetical protein
MDGDAVAKSAFSRFGRSIRVRSLILTALDDAAPVRWSRS